MLLDDDDDGAEEAPEAYIEYARKRGLVETDEPDLIKPVYRKTGFAGVFSAEEMDRRVGMSLKQLRDRRDLNQREMAALLGLSPQVYGRYERGLSALTVGRMVITAEILGFDLSEMMVHVAPHLYGNSQETADARAEIAARVARMPEDMVLDLVEMIRRLDKLRKG